MSDADGDGLGKYSDVLDYAVLQLLIDSKPMSPEQIREELKSQPAFSQLALDDVRSSLHRLIQASQVFARRYYST